MIIHYGKPQKNSNDQQWPYHLSGNQTLVGHAQTWKKTNHFAQHLAKVFTPHPRNNNDDEIEAHQDTPCQLSPLLKAFSPTQVRQGIKQLNPHKAPGYDLIDGTVLKRLPRKATVLLTSIFNSMLRLCYFPVQWKYAQIIMIAKPGNCLQKLVHTDR